MSGDLLIITPSRGRPVNVARLLATVHQLRHIETHVHVCVDDGDPAYEDYQRVFAQQASDGDGLITGPRKSLAAWTNHIALKEAANYTCLASFGDDHVPRTRGFDKALVTAATENGPAIAYPFDGIREDIPEAPVLDSRIVTALGWMFEPSLHHFYVDTTLADLGRGAGCLRYLRAIAVDHLHASNGRAEADTTYAESSRKIPTDKAAWIVWRKERMAADVATVIALRESVLQPA